MSVLRLMCGLPFSGKSTLAKAIVAETGWAYVSLDDINEERGLGFGGDGIPPEEWERSHAVALARLQERLAAGNAILDDTCCFRWIRDRYRALASEGGHATRVVHLRTSDEEIRSRMARNEETAARHGVREEVFRAVAEPFELPAEDEDTVVFDGTENTQAWIAEHL